MSQKFIYYGGIVTSIIGLLLFILINPMYFILFGIGVLCIYAGRKKASGIQKDSQFKEFDASHVLHSSNIEQRAVHEKEAKAPNKVQETEFLEIVDGSYLLSYKYSNVKIAMPSLNSVSLGDFLSFEQEPTNTYDDKAVKIMCGLDKIGYVYRGKMQEMINDFLKKELPIEARIDSISEDYLSYSIAFYKDINSFDSVNAVLTKTTKKDEFGNSRQDNLSCINSGDILYSEYDYDTGTYIISDDCGNEVGELSKSISEKIRSKVGNKNCRIICHENSVDDSLLYKCKVLIVL